MKLHTPGPWGRIIADGYTVRHPQIYSDTGPVANATWLGDGRLDELNANARLIASAPDLLAALRGLRDAFIGTSVEVQADAMRAARVAWDLKKVIEHRLASKAGPAASSKMSPQKQAPTIT